MDRIAILAEELRLYRIETDARLDKLEEDNADPASTDQPATTGTASTSTTVKKTDTAS